MPDRTSPPLLYGALALVVLLLAGAAGYVYSHEPTRDQLVINIEATPIPPADVISGAIRAGDATSVTLITADGAEVTIALPEGIPVEDLVRANAALEAGAQVNVGVDNTAFGQVLTGIVAIEGATTGVAQ